MSKAKTSHKRQAGNHRAEKQAHPAWSLLKFVPPAPIFAALAFLGDGIITPIFEATGLGLFLLIPWLAAISFVALSKKKPNIAKRWNLWLGLFSLTLATWGILSLSHPTALAIGQAHLDEVTMGGNLGKWFIGNQGVGAHPALRLAILMGAGVWLLAPRKVSKLAWLLLKMTGKALRATFPYIRSLARGLVRLSGLIFRFAFRLPQKLINAYRKYPLHRLAAARIMAIFKKIPAGPVAELKVKAPHLPRAARKAEAAITVEAEPQQAPPAPAVDAENTTKKAHAIKTWKLPSIDFMEKAVEAEPTGEDHKGRAKLIEDALASYGVEAKVTQINPGPSITQFGIEPGWDHKYKRVVEKTKTGEKVERMEEVSKTRVKVERISALTNNLALALAVPSIRIEAPVPGKPLVGIEVPNNVSSSVSMRSVIDSRTFQKLSARTKLAIALGKGPSGEVVVADLAKMPHLLIAGATGSGKTVCLNGIIACLLAHNRPEDTRMLLIDPKRVELVSYNGVPHLMTPVVVDPSKAMEALSRTVREMEERFTKFAAVGARNIDGYNHSPLITEPMPYLVVVIDELADLMMTAAEVVEPLICRLAQLARATGIHLVVATQRPSVDVITGLIKANFPTRISFAVASQVDSRTILDSVGAEQLLGRGDMLYLPPDAPKPRRLQGCYVSDKEIDKLVSFWKHEVATYASFEDSVARAFAALKISDSAIKDPLLDSARRLAKEHDQISTSLLQRSLHIGYPRAAKLMEFLEQEQIVDDDDEMKDSGSDPELFGQRNI